MKKCNKCFQWKDESQFNKVKLDNTCKECVSIMKQNWNGRICICSECHFEKTHYAKGMCRKCYREKQENSPTFHTPTPETKVCARCKIEKPHTDFPKHESMKDGLDSYCKECNNDRPRRKIICSDCGELKEQFYKTWCSSCYVRNHREYPVSICKQCNNEREIYLKEMCRSCYEKTLPKDLEKLRAQKRTARQNNPEKFREKDRERNKDPQRKEYQRKRLHQRLIDKIVEIREYHRKYRKENPDKVVRWSEERRSRDRGLPYTLTDEQWEQLKIENNFCCYYCGNPPKRKLHQEHRVSSKNGGGYTYENIAPSCERCNQRKHDKNEDEFITFMRAHPEEFVDARFIR